MISNLTTHAKRDRMARLEYIIDTVGVGKVMCEATFHDAREGYDDTVRQLTSTGVIIIKSSRNQVVTAYIATHDQALDVWQKAFGRHKKMLPALSKKITSNTEYRKGQPC